MIIRKFNEKFGPNVTTFYNIDDFEFYKQVGEGSFGQVYLARHKESDKFVAIKQLDKADLIKKEKTEAEEKGPNRYRQYAPKGGEYRRRYQK